MEYRMINGSQQLCLNRYQECIETEYVRNQI